MVKTRSQTKKEKLNGNSCYLPKIYENNKIPKAIYEVNIDFDAASKAWTANKKSMGNGHYRYICTVEKNGSKCGKSCYKNLIYCWIHRCSGK